MKHIYMAISITYHSLSCLGPDCDFYQRVDDNPMTHEKLDYNQACRMMRELQLAGGERTVRVNQFNPAISTVEVEFYTKH